MVIHRFVRLAALLFAVMVPALVLPLEAHARSVKETRSSVKAGSKSKAAKSKKRVAKRSRGRGKFSGRAVGAAELRQEALPRPSGRVVVRAPGVHDEVDLNIYREDGSFDQASLARLDRLFRCRRTGEERAVDPRLYEILSIIHDKFGGPIELNSGFRYQRNEGSRHFHGSAMDIQIPGVSFRELYSFAQTLDRGGMGIGKYPHSSFVHIDFRAPGEPSYRWTDTQRTKNNPGKAPSKMWKRSSRPNT